MRNPNLGLLSDYQRYLHSDPPPPQDALMHREVLTKATYDKWLIPVKGEPEKTNAPCGVALGCGPRWKIWKMEDLRIAYDPVAFHTNEWFANFVRLYPGVTPVKGALVIFQWEEQVKHTMSHVEMVLGRWCWARMCKKFKRAKSKRVTN